MSIKNLITLDMLAHTFNFIKTNFLFFSILFIALFLRLILIDKIPVGLTNDEMSGVYNGYSMLTTGRNLSSQPWLYALFFTAPMNPMAEFHPFFSLGGLLLFGQTLLGARFSFAIIGVCAVAAMYFFVRNLTQNRSYALCASLFLAISPWHIYLSRSAYEAPVGLFLILCGLACLFSSHKLIVLISSMFFIASFHEYQGLKLVTPLLLIFLLFYFLMTKSINKVRFMSIVISLIWFAVYLPFFFAWSDQSKRFLEVSNADNNNYAEEIELARRESALPEISHLIDNKYSYSIRNYTVKLTGFFSQGLLFTGEFYDVAFILPRHGLMYFVDALFLVVGICALANKHKKLLILAVLILLIGLVPAILSKVSTSYLFRGQISLIGLLIISSYGFYVLFNFVVFQRKILRASLLMILAGSSTYFMTMYLAVTPAKGATWYGYSDQLLSAYLTKVDDKKVAVVTNDVRNEFLSFAFYNKLDANYLQKAIESRNYSYNGITFVQDCPLEETYDLIVVERINQSCGELSEGMLNLYDATGSWSIYGDQLCLSYSNRYDAFTPDWNFAINYDVSLLNNVQLCEKWFYTEPKK